MELIPQRNCHVLITSNWKEWILCSKTLNRLFAASHSRGTNPPFWRAKVALGQDKQKTYYIILNGNFLCLSCPSATFALQHGGFVPREWLGPIRPCSHQWDACANASANAHANEVQTSCPTQVRQPRSLPLRRVSMEPMKPVFSYFTFPLLSFAVWNPNASANARQGNGDF